MSRTTITAMAAALALSATTLFVEPAAAQQADRSKGQQAQPQQQQSRQGRIDAADRMLEDRVFVRLAERAWAGGDFKITANEGTVTLSGSVPSEQTRGRILRVVRRTLGVTEVRDQLRVDPSVAPAQAPGLAMSDADLSKAVAQKIASAFAGAKAGEDWWFTGWRVEGPDNNWNVTVESTEGRVTLEGEVPQNSIIRKAVEAALQVKQVRSVRSEIEWEPRSLYGYPYGYGYPYWTYPYGYHPYYGAYRHDPDVFVYYDADRANARGSKGVHTVTGEVTRVDQQKGTLSLKTGEGTMDLHFPPSALQNVKKGDRITVELSLKDAAMPAASPKTSGTSSK